jgi:hypothetical protein
MRDVTDPQGHQVKELLNGRWKKETGDKLPTALTARIG